MDENKNSYSGSGPDHPDDGRYVLPESSSLIILLILFLSITIVTLGSILAGGHEKREKGAVATKAYGPEDVKGVDFDEPNREVAEMAKKPAQGEPFMVPPPPFSEDIYPCSDCHDGTDVDLKPRKLVDMHEDIVLNHGPKDRWCFDCHNPYDRDKLRLINGTLISFDESYKLCGQCHGTIYRDWRQGIHGRRRGYWNGQKEYLLCAHCHNPHSPHFKPIKPLPPPVQPKYLRQVFEEAKK